MALNRFAQKRLDGILAMYVAHPQLLWYQTMVILLMLGIFASNSKLAAPYMVPSGFNNPYTFSYGMYTCLNLFFYKWAWARHDENDHLVLSTRMSLNKAAAHLVIQIINNEVAHLIEAGNTSIDGFAVAAVFTFTAHILTNTLAAGIAFDITFADSLSAVVIALLSHLWGGLITRVIIPILSALYFIWKDRKANHPAQQGGRIALQGVRITNV